MRILFSLAVLVLGASTFMAQTYNNENWSNGPHQVFWGFNGNVALGANQTWYFDPTINNGGVNKSATPDPVAVPFNNTIGNFCIGLDAPTSSANSGDTWTLMHKSGSTWVASSVAVALSGTSTSPVCNNTDSVSPSGPGDMLSIRVVTGPSTSSNTYTALSFVSPPIPVSATVLTQNSNILPAAANGVGIWTTSAAILANIAPVSIYCDIVATACSATADMLTQQQAGKAGTISNLCVRVARLTGSNDPYTVTLNVNGVDTALVATVPVGAAIGNYCDSTHSVSVSQNSLIVYNLLDTAFNNGLTFNTGDISFLF